LIKEGTIYEMEDISKKKFEFLLNNFEKMIGNNDNIQYRDTNNVKYIEEEDI